MAIKSIKITNFKSFENLNVELNNFNVLIGANASGKSNFIQLFKFLKDIVYHGLDNAISMQGGIEYLRNIIIGLSKDIFIEIVADQKLKFVIEKDKRLIGLEIYEINYKFIIGFSKRGASYKISEDILTQKCKLHVLKRKKKGGFKEEKSLGQGEITISNVKGKVHVDLALPDGELISEEDIFPPYFKELHLEPKTLLLENTFFVMPPLRNIFRGISVYDFDPKLPKKAAPITGKVELEEDGSNLTLILKNIIKNKDRERKFSNLIKDLLPFVNKIDVEKFADKSLLFKLRESYFKKEYLPASLLSDGTINITSLIVALYFEDKPLTIIEEPERNIHPYLISKVIDMMKDASKEKQIIVTTHNPEIVKYAGLKNILLISRDDKGFSNISKPYEKEDVKIFLEKKMGIEELYVQNLLEI